MIIIDKKYRKIIEAFVKKVKARQKKEDQEYSQLLQKIGVAPKSSIDDTIWDHVYNDSDWLFQYSDQVASDPGKGSFNSKKTSKS